MTEEGIYYIRYVFVKDISPLTELPNYAAYDSEDWSRESQFSTLIPASRPLLFGEFVSNGYVMCHPPVFEKQLDAAEYTAKARPLICGYDARGAFVCCFRI